MGRQDEDLVVEWIGEEALVYDTASDEAHCLTGDAAAEFGSASDEVSRRQVLRKLALVGAAAAGAAPLIRTIVAPAPAHAQSACGFLFGPCCTGNTCPGAPPPGTQIGCSNGQCVQVCGAPLQTCCAAGNTCGGGTICQNGTCQFCGAAGNPCCTSGTVCLNSVCLNGICQCGGSGQPCCQPGNGCGTGLTCDVGGTNTCS